MRSDLQLKPEQQILFTNPVVESESFEVLQDDYKYEGDPSDYFTYVSDAYYKMSLDFHAWSLIAAPQVKVRIGTWPATYDRLDLSTIIELILSVPDVTLFRAITVIDYRHRDQIWLNLENSGVLTKEILESGDVLLYRPENISNAQQTIFDGFSRLLKSEDENQFESDLFDQLVSIEGSTYYSNRGKGAWSKEQIWADLFCLMFCTDTKAPWAIAHFDAVPSVLIAACIRRHLNSVPEILRSPRHSKYLELLQFIELNVSVVAQQRITELRDTNNGPFIEDYCNFLKREFPNILVS